MTVSWYTQVPSTHLGGLTQNIYTRGRNFGFHLKILRATTRKRRNLRGVSATTGSVYELKAKALAGVPGTTLKTYEET